MMLSRATTDFLFGHGQLERYSLAYVRELKVLPGLECTTCRKFAVLDTEELAARDGPDLTLGAIRERARCRSCGAVRPVILLRRPGLRGDLAWHPRPPGLRR